LVVSAAVVGGALCLSACGAADAPLPEAAADAADALADASPPLDAGDGEAATTCELPGPYGSPECNRCLAERCCDVISACVADPECRALDACNRACIGDRDAGGCRAGCVLRNPEGEEQLKKLDACGSDRAPAGCFDVCTYVP